MIEKKYFQLKFMKHSLIVTASKTLSLFPPSRVILSIFSLLLRLSWLNTFSSRIRLKSLQCLPAPTSAITNTNCFIIKFLGMVISDEIYCTLVFHLVFSLGKCLLVQFISFTSIFNRNLFNHNKSSTSTVFELGLTFAFYTSRYSDPARHCHFSFQAFWKQKRKKNISNTSSV